VLSEYCRQYLSDSQKPIHILNNLPLDSLVTVSNSLKNIRNSRKNNEEIQIVITSGTLSHKQILNEMIFPVLANILGSHSKVKLLVIGHIDIGSELKKFGQRIQSIPFSDYSTYLDLLTTSDIALVPLEVHPTTHGKSAIKWMEASLCGVTCICSPVRAYTDVISHGETGLIAETAEEWHQAIIQLMEDPSKMRRIAEKARNHANNLFDSEMGREFWRNQISKSISTTTTTNRPCKKVLVMNVFFAHQSIGGATRVAQDYVQTMLTDDQTNYEITVLCTEYNNWQSDPANLQNLKEIEQEPFLADLQHIDYQNYQQKVQVDVSHWRGAKIIRLSLPPKVWSEYHDPLVEAFCEDLFISESFDLVQCHCCQLLTAAPLVVARRHKIPYEIVMHDAWWMSHQQFLVSAAGRLIDPADPLGHFDQQPSPDEAQQALQRRSDLYQLLEDAQRRIAVSEAFKKICESAGIKNVDVQVNTVTDMGIPARSKRLSPKASINNYNLCHIGGMSLHKGYQLLRQAVHYLPQSLPIQFTIIDHRLSSSKNNYESIWNGYHVNFIAPIPMDKMPEFYSEQDVLIAPSIWPESFGLVTREALSAGLWVIASDAGALAEPILNTPEKNGTVIQPNNLEDLVSAIKALPIDLNTTRLNGGK
jgi:glycosyltransferase involved in cell wall biosynthesis